MVLRTKLHIPPTRRDGLIERAGITEILNKGLKSKLTAITAPGGYGKTTALSQWLQQSGISAVWVSLDPQDNDPIQFWSCAIAAVGSKHPRFAEAVSPHLSSLRSGAFQPFVAAMIQELHSYQEELVIVFDDYHTIDLAAIHASVAYFLAYLPAHIHLYITSRAEMPFPAARLQTTGQMVKITIQDLRFQVEEGTRYFKDCMRISLSEEEIASLVSRTEGWISGLHLAAISLQESSSNSAFIRAFSGENRGISDYLFQEVFSLQSEKMQSFLIQTSILNRMSSPLCEAVTGQNDCQALLETLEHRNLFIVPLDERRQWYRYHHLFSEFLQRLFRQKYAAASKPFRVQAAHWLEEHGFMKEAVEQLLMNEDPVVTSAFIEKHLRDFHVKSGFDQLPWSADTRAWDSRALRTLPESCFEGKPGIQFLYIKVLVEAGEFEAADSRIRLMEDKLSEPAWEPYVGTILYFSAGVSFYRKDFQRANEYFELFDRKMPKGAHFQLMEANSYSFTFDTFLTFFGNLHEAEQFLHPWIGVWEGRENYPFIGYLYNSYSWLLYEWNRLEEAEIYTERVLRSNCMQPYALITVIAYIVAAQIGQANGNSAKAFELLEQAKSKIHSEDKNLFMRKIEAEQAYLSLINGSFDGSWLRTCGMQHTDTVLPGSIREYQHVARALMACGRFNEALLLLDQLYRLADEQDRLWDKVKVTVLQSIVLYRKGDAANAAVKLECALQLAEPDKFLRSFLDEGSAMAELLHEYVRQRRRHANRESSAVSLNYVGDLLRRLTEHTNKQEVPSSLLTNQELTVLRMIDTGLSNKEIAEQLRITAETVKSHLKNLYRKLEANNRVQALKQGKVLKLL
ncbi:LuxR C-terminal-related transcriptional regulator [Cohnella sp. GCM10020058]|uniref:LuxR C-terminal-related transcriptional regulator n=1 Tax=Cohnella sp. GCM10020058 TaxID=3317330 RepID=UPI00362A0FE1